VRIDQARHERRARKIDDRCRRILRWHLREWADPGDAITVSDESAVVDHRLVSARNDASTSEDRHSRPLISA
jgi:hypothetical protein